MDVSALINQAQAGAETLQALAAAYVKKATAEPAGTLPALVGGAALVYVVFMWAVRIMELRKMVKPPVCKTVAEHTQDVAAVCAEVRAFLAHRKPGQAMSIKRSRGGHTDSNRTIDAVYKKLALQVDVSKLDCVVGVVEAAGGRPPLMIVEPGVPMDELARVALAHGYVPQLVLEFPGITVGGAICGGGIESSSHAHGSFYDTVEEVDLITGDGVFRQGVSRTNEPDLFAGLNTTYGSMGILTRVAVRLERATKYVRVRYLHADSTPSACAAMTGLANAASAPAFIDGCALSPTSAMVVVGDYADSIAPEAPLRTLRQRRSDPWFFWHLTTLSRSMPALSFDKGQKMPGKGRAAEAGSALRAYAGAQETLLLEDYLFRFDRGAFWMARHGLSVFWGSAAYKTGGLDAGPSTWVRVKYAWLASTRQLYRMLHAIGDEMLARHYVVQDYIMPDGEAASELSYYTGQPSLDIWPLWLCPVRMTGPRHPSNGGFGFPVQQTPPGGLMVNVGVYGPPGGGAPFDPAVLNKALENKATALGGRKMLYAQSFYEAAEFWSLFDKAAYERVRKMYGAVGVFPDVATKLLLGPERLARLGGIKPVSFGNVAWSMAKWYGSLWGEALLPRALHGPGNAITNTGMTAYEEYPADAPSRLDVAYAKAGPAEGSEGGAGAGASARKRRGSASAATPRI